MEVLEEHWVKLASCMFEKVATFQWESTLATNFVGREFNTITYLEFLLVFNVRYYLELLREQRTTEFSNFKQVDMTVCDYEQKFIQLERFAPTMCSAKKARTNKFIWCLRLALKDQVANQRPQTLAQPVQIACLLKEVLNEQFGPLKNDKGKTSVNGNNNKNVTNQP